MQGKHIIYLIFPIFIQNNFDFFFCCFWFRGGKTMVAHIFLFLQLCKYNGNTLLSIKVGRVKDKTSRSWRIRINKIHSIPYLKIHLDCNRKNFYKFNNIFLQVLVRMVWKWKTVRTYNNLGIGDIVKYSLLSPVHQIHRAMTIYRVQVQAH